MKQQQNKLSVKDMKKKDNQDYLTNNHYSVPIEEYKAILSDFDFSSVGYCVLRNFEFLFDSRFPWEGLDISVREEDFKKINNILLRHGFRERKRQFSLKHRAYFKLVDGIKVSFDIQIGGVYWNDMKYFGESIIANRVRKEFFYVPNNTDMFFMLLIHSILGKRRFKPKYEQIMSSLLEQGSVDETLIVQNLSSVFTNKRAKELLALVKEKQFHKIPILTLLFLFLLKKPKNIATLAALTIRWICWKRPLTPYPLISIVGPDGAGKSTLVASLHMYLQENKRNPMVVYMGRGRDHILPFTKLGKRFKQAEKKQDAISLQSSSSLRSYASLRRSVLYTLSSALFFLDLSLRYWLIIFPSRMRKKIVITDRYGTDIILMKNVPFWWKKTLYSLFLKPTVSVLLYNTPDVLHQRRPEETIQELQRQMEIFNQLSYDLRLETKEQEENNRKVIDFVTTKLLIDWY